MCVSSVPTYEIHNAANHVGGINDKITKIGWALTAIIQLESEHM
jgi:hypothetical protein